MFMIAAVVEAIVICRIGSLEILVMCCRYPAGVICRIGSLEMPAHSVILCDLVICRIGSLETVPIVQR